MYYCTPEALPMFLNLLESGLVLSSMDMMKKSNFINIASSTSLSFNAFLPVLCSIFSYARTFNESYAVSFCEDMVVGI